MKKITSFAKDFGPYVLSFALPAAALAQNVPPPQAPGQTNVPQGTINSLGSVLQTVCTVFGWAFYFLLAFAVLLVIVAAFKYLTAGGDAEKVKSAGNTLLYAAVAVGVALLARAVPLVVGSFLGTSLAGQTC